MDHQGWDWDKCRSGQYFQLTTKCDEVIWDDLTEVKFSQVARICQYIVTTLTHPTMMGI